MKPLVTIRRAEIDDHRDLCAIHASPGVVRGTLQLPMPSSRVWRRRLENAPDSSHDLVAVIDDRVVGAASLVLEARSPRRRHVGSVGMAVHDDWQRRGVGTALLAALLDLADNWLNLARLELYVFADNVAAVSLYQRFGFVEEGTLARYAFRDGDYADALLMARLRPAPGTAAAGEPSGTT